MKLFPDQINTCDEDAMMTAAEIEEWVKENKLTLKYLLVNYDLGTFEVKCDKETAVAAEDKEAKKPIDDYRKITFENEAQKNCPFCGSGLNPIRSMLPGDGGSLCEVGVVCKGCGAAGVLSYELDHPYQTVWESEPRDSAFRFDPDAWA